MTENNEQSTTPIETKVSQQTGDAFSKSQRSTYQGPQGPVDLAPQNLVNPTPTESPAPTIAPATDQGSDTGSGTDT